MLAAQIFFKCTVHILERNVVVTVPKLVFILLIYSYSYTFTEDSHFHKYE